MKYKILLILFIISFASSLTLSLKPASEFCNPGEGCEIVHASKYNYSFGIQNSHYGGFIFAFLILLIFLQMKKPDKIKEKIIYVSVIIGALIAVYFLYIQHFILNAYCKYCLLVDFSMIAALIVILPELKNIVKK